jgi:hypothetical protein
MLRWIIRIFLVALALFVSPVVLIGIGKILFPGPQILAAGGVGAVIILGLAWWLTAPQTRRGPRNRRLPTDDIYPRY